MGIERFVSPDAPLTFVFPETRNPSVMGEPRASFTAEFAFAPPKAFLKKPVVWFPQVGFCARGTGRGFCSTESFYFSREAFCNENTLTFTLVSDTCRDRKKNVLLAWHQNSRQPLRQPSPNCPSVSAQTRSFNCVLPAVRAQ